MHPADQKPIEILNTLVGVNNNRIECYHFVATKTDISVLQVLFWRLTETSLQCREELVQEIHKLGGKPQDGTLGTREFFKAWLDVHAALSRQDHKAILESCCYEEGVVIKTYEQMLKNELDRIPGYQQQLLCRQYEVLRADSMKVNNLRNALVKD
jgi:uncharacterized protein (TIGR02284 family)